MEDLGSPIAYMALEEGTPVYTSDGVRIGQVAHVLADPDADVFDGLVIDGELGHRFVDAPETDSLFEGGVVLSLDRAAAESLPEPSANPATLRADPADAEESELSEKLRRAWDYISGRY